MSLQKRPIRPLLPPRAPRRVLGDEEHQHQSAFVEWASITRLPEWLQTNEVTMIGDVLHAIPNGGHRSKTQGAKLKAEGAKAGVWDMFLPIPSGPWHGLWIEFKSSTGRVEPEQRKWERKMQSLGFNTMVCFSVDSAIAGMKLYLDGGL